MAQETYLVAYDGEQRGAAEYAAAHARKTGAKLYVLHVLEWSPYSFLTPEELAERHKRRREEMARAETAVIAPILRTLRADGVEVEAEIRYGKVADLVLTIAREQKAAMIFVGRSNTASVSERVFGSVPMALAQAAPVPTVVVP